MRHRNSGRKLNKSSSHRKAMFANMATSLFLHERIQTTTPKAKELRGFADRLVTLAKRGDAHAKRLAARYIQDREVLDKLFGELATRFAERPGGYTRVLHLGNRTGDNAPMSIVEVVGVADAIVESIETPEDEGGEEELAEA
ncbi:MAG: 50S ribosomal protein L17 [Myxococcales bacterium]|nr:50S ribosomal protein L17 [Myxococcales bacterium]MCB9519896.1 50S ribosomal protein L17 [Myxococcales bacterium]MCB9533197.1 50S ribosomal protein L17 [Myxococcales bacterium]